MLEFLPDKIEIPVEFDFFEIVEQLYEIFQRDIKNCRLRYRGLPVFFDNRKIDSGYEEGFWHLIERGKQERTLDIKRAKRLPWLKPLIENSDDPRLCKWVEDKINNRGDHEEVTHIYFREEQYIVILKDRKKGFFLATAFYISGYNRQKYYDRYVKAIKKGPGC